MNHSFLFEEGAWDVKGIIFSEGKREEGIGRITVKHEEYTWVMESWLNIKERGTELINNIVLEPFAENILVTNWKSFNPAIGKINGSLVIQNEYIIVVFASEDNLFSGTEYIRKIDDSYYKSKGSLFKEDKLFSSWDVKLKRTE